MTPSSQRDSSRDSSEDIQLTLYVLDSYALLAYFTGEEGAEVVADLIERTSEDAALFLSLINFGEVAYITEREKGSEGTMELLEDIRRLPITLCEVSEQRVLAAAHIKAYIPSPMPMPLLLPWLRNSALP